MRAYKILLYLYINCISAIKNTYPFLAGSYPYDPRIHTFGNVGIGGKIHAEIAPVFTKLIDVVAYDSLDIRKAVLINENRNKAIIDLCCGVGFSTSNNEESMGIDTSVEMIDKAKSLYPDKKFIVEHAEHFKPQRTWDIATCFFAFHEMPPFAWENIIINTEKFTKDKIIIVDISPNYIPSRYMLLGEPYIKEYIEHIQNVLHTHNFKENVLIPNHVHKWEKYLN
jgi:hypothetical protein